MSLDFVAVDVETANSQRGSICAFDVAVVQDGQVTRAESWLSRPPASLDWFDDRNISIHGIRPASVTDQPSFAERLAQILDIVGDLPVVAHNAAFDIGAIRQGCDAAGVDWPRLTYGCSLILSRRVLNLLSYRLPIVCSELDVSLSDHHNAGADAEAAARVTIALADRRNAGTLDELASGAHVRLGQLMPNSWECCAGAWSGTGSGHPDAPEANPDADPAPPLNGQVIVFTGALSLRRGDAWAAAAALGATPEKDVNKRTTMLVIGDGFTANSLDDFRTSKAEKAILWQAKGHRIEVLTEGVFLQMLEEGV
jgi:DNA polymerase-3 subunit epsilon